MGVKKVKNYPACKKIHKSKKFAQADGYFFLSNSMLSLIHYMLYFWSLLVVNLGSNWSEKCKKVPVLLKTNPKYSKFALTAIFLREIQWCH